MNIQVNKYQTPLTEELLESLNNEVREQLLDFINNVEFIKNLISPDRKYARDLPRDEKGRIIVDLCNPHILEDMEYFRPTGNCFKKHGKVTLLKPNGNPRSEFGRWFGEEIRRCWEGYVRESDGEWVTGFEYFYLNYEPIIQIKQIGKKKQASRIVDFPKVWEGVHLVFHYLEQARHGGTYDDFEGGKHAVEIARRGASKSYIVAGILACIFLVGENADACRETRGIVTAYDREKLIKDGTLNKFSAILDFCAEHTQFPYQRLQDSLDKMTWKLGYKDLNTNAEMGLKNVTLGVTAKDNVEKCHPYSCNVPTPEGIRKWGDIQVGDYVFSEHGKPIKVLQTFERDEDNIYKITLKDGRVTYATKDHLWEIVYRSACKFKTRIVETEFLIDNTIRHDKNYNLCKWAIRKGGCVQFPEKKVEIEPYVMGLFLGDGCASKSHGGNLNITMLPEDMKECSTHYSYDTRFSTYGRGITHLIQIPKIRNKLDKYGLAYSNHSNKFIPKEYLFNSEQNRIDLLNGLLDSDGSCTKDYGVIEYSTKSAALRDDFIYLVRSLGINAKWFSKIVNGETYYRCYIYSNDSRLFNLKRKKDRLKSKLSGYSKSFIDKTHIVSIEYSHRERCKCVLVDNPTHLYMIDDFIVTHNSRGKRSNFFGYEEFGAFKKFIDTWGVNLPSVQEGDIAFGLAFAIGTGGSEGNDFSGALEIIYNPMGYNVYALPNVFDKVNSAKQKTVFFFGAYLNLAGHYNEDGVSDVIGALIQILNNRYKIKYNSSDPMSLTRAKAENPITIQEAIMKRDSTMYPVADLTDRLNSLDSDSHAYDDVYVGDLGMDNDYPFPKTGPEYESIRTFPHKNNKLTGAIEFYKMPERDSNGNIISGRYIAGCLTPGELVLTGEGAKKVEEVTISDALINEEGKIVPVRRLLRYDVTNEDTYRIRVSNTLRATNFTKEHPILASKGNRGYVSRKKCKREGTSQRYYKFDFSYKKAEEIEKGDWIKVPNIYKNSREIDLDKYWNEDLCRIDRRSDNLLSNTDFWWFVGLWLGDGWCESNGYKISIAFNSKETEYIDRLKSFVRSKLDRCASLRGDGNSMELSFSYQYLSEFLIRNFGKYADGKCIPEWVKYLPTEYKKSLIQGYIDSDGCISETSNGYYTYFTSINLPLLEGFQDILFSLGIISGVKVLRKAGLREIVKGKTSTTKECYELSIAYHHTVKLCSILSNELFKDHKVEKVDLLKYNKRRRPEGDCFFSPNEDYIYFQIKDIEKGSYTGIVYNFECETHTFMCPHITTHNCDPYDDDQSDTLSLGSIIVLDTFTDCIVCEYTGRPDFADDFYEKCRRILLFYNARANYENNKKGLFKYFSQTNSLYLLADTLDFLKERDDSVKNLNNKSKGSQSTEPIKRYARRCIADWLNKPTIIPNEDPEKESITIKHLTKIKGRALLLELMSWNSDGNFDRHDALGMCMLYREDIFRLSGGDPEGSNSSSGSDKADDDFFSRNFEKAMKRKEKIK